MTVEHFLQSIYVGRLKGMTMNERDLVRFDQARPLTAIMGPNGFGKSSILHVLAASFRPAKVRKGTVNYMAGEEHQYSEFLPSTPDEKWAGTKIRISSQIKRGDNTENRLTHIEKNEAGAWQPQQTQKIERETYFIGVSSALPEVEAKRANDDFLFTTIQELADDESKKIRDSLSYIFNRDYSSIFRYETSHNTEIVGLTHKGISYSSLSMGAGEQRVFKILKVVVSANKYALVLIDELDLLLHTEALDRLLDQMQHYAVKKKLQIIFTTHRESVLEHSRYVAIRHVYKSIVSPFNTHWFSDTKPGAIERLTGKLDTSLVICCEDEIARAIISRVAESLEMSTHVAIKLFGSWKNCFTLAAALALEGRSSDESLFVLDGDVAECKTKNQWEEILNSSLTGTSAESREQRQCAIQSITHFCPINGESPERTLYDMVRSGVKARDKREQQLIDAFNNLEAVDDRHDYVLIPLSRLGIERSVGFDRIVAIASRSGQWKAYVGHIKKWLSNRKHTVVEAQAISRI